MSRKKKSGNDKHTVEKLLIATAITNLLTAITNLIKSLSG